MSNFVAVHDARLKGNAIPTRPLLTTIDTDDKTSIHLAFQGINTAARAGKIPALFILCHGFAGSNNAGAVSMDAGGMGLQLGKEAVTHSNVAMWNTIRDKVAFIVVYACAAGDTQRGNEGTTADGKYLMGALALAANCEVYAADKIQWYNGKSPNGLDFGKWEGQLWKFPADGSAPTPAVSAPIEFSDVMSGICPADF